MLACQLSSLLFSSAQALPIVRDIQMAFRLLARHAQHSTHLRIFHVATINDSMGHLEFLMYAMGWLKRPSEESEQIPEPKAEKRREQLPYYGKDYYVSRMKRV